MLSSLTKRSPRNAKPPAPTASRDDELIRATLLHLEHVQKIVDGMIAKITADDALTETMKSKFENYDPKLIELLYKSFPPHEKTIVFDRDAPVGRYDCIDARWLKAVAFKGPPGAETCGEALEVITHFAPLYHALYAMRRAEYAVDHIPPSMLADYRARLSRG
jgi:hypothetical protein